MQAKRKENQVGIRSMVALLNLPCFHLRIQCLHHHLYFPPVLDQQTPALKHNTHSINHLVEATGGSTFLSQANDAQRIPFAVLNNGHDLGRKRDVF
jgi:hypothetical protein